MSQCVRRDFPSETLDAVLSQILPESVIVQQIALRSGIKQICSDASLELVDSHEGSDPIHAVLEFWAKIYVASRCGSLRSV